MTLAEDDVAAVNRALAPWRQGDVTLDAGLVFLHVADLTRPHSSVSYEAAEGMNAAGEPFDTTPTAVSDDAILGLVVLTQTCDIIRDCRQRPYMEVAPLVHVSDEEMDAIRRLRKPAFAYVPGVADQKLVADLDRVMTVEKAVVSRWSRVCGCATDDDRRNFSRALRRKLARFAFPDDFVTAARAIQGRILQKHNRSSDEGAHLRALREIRVRAAPGWTEHQVQITWWFIKAEEPQGATKVDWQAWATRWLDLFDSTGRFRCDPPVVCRLEDMTGRDLVESDVFDFDRLSV